MGGGGEQNISFLNEEKENLFRHLSSRIFYNLFFK